MGEWKNVIIDDLFPCIWEDSGPCYSRTNEGELWLLLLEKAYSKVYGCY